jgi:hypothetical protein
MSRTAARFKQSDVTRALRAARAAGLDVSGYEIDPFTGRIIVSTASPNGSKPVDEEGVNEWDKVL